MGGSNRTHGGIPEGNQPREATSTTSTPNMGEPSHTYSATDWQELDTGGDGASYIATNESQARDFTARRQVKGKKSKKE